MAETLTAEKDGQRVVFVRSAFEKVWKGKGWTEVSDQPVEEKPVRTRVASSESPSQ